MLADTQVQESAPQGLPHAALQKDLLQNTGAGSRPRDSVLARSPAILILEARRNQERCDHERAA
jgi:hypothetical protein